MIKIDEVIEAVKNVRTGVNAPWIYKDGEIADNILICDVIPLLEALKEYEIETDLGEDYFEDYETADNTYNWNASISNDLDFKTKNGFALVRVHLFGDIRCGYADYFIVEMDGYDSFIEFCYYTLEDKCMQYKDINNRYSADLDIFSEGYTVWDNLKEEEVGVFYEMEADRLLEYLKETEN